MFVTAIVATIPTQIRLCATVARVAKNVATARKPTAIAIRASTEGKRIMAEPVGFQGANVLFSGEAVGCRDLETFSDGRQIISCWRLSPEELELIQKTGVVWLSVMGRALPPVLVSAVALVEVNGQPSKAEPILPKKVRRGN